MPRSHLLWALVALATLPLVLADVQIAQAHGIEPATMALQAANPETVTASFAENSHSTFPRSDKKHLHGVADGDESIDSTSAPVSEDNLPMEGVLSKEMASPKRVVTSKEESPKEVISPKQEASPKEAVTPKGLVTPKEAVTPKGLVTLKEVVVSKEDSPKAVTPKEESSSKEVISPKADVPIEASVSTLPESTSSQALLPSTSPKHGNPTLNSYETPSSVATPSPPHVATSTRTPNVSEYETHPCARTCEVGAPPLTCRYRFVLEDYQALSKACYACADNATDCTRPHCVAVDGVPRSLVVVNRQLPGPGVEVCLGDRVVVDVDNRLLDASTSIHWHGHHQRGTQFMDGVPHVTQCPVPPKTAFRYRYVADTPGTHFWHSHSGCQRADGAFGAFIVRKPRAQETHTQLYDEDLSEQHTVQVLDWTHVSGAAKFLAHHHAAGDNKPDTILINGKGRWLDRDIELDRLATFTVQKGVRYRFRLINAGFLNCPIQVSVDNHTLTVIASDGSDLQPVEAASLVSYAGERWDFVLSASAPVGNYWLRARGLMDCDERFKSAHQLAVLRYEGARAEQPAGPIDYEAGRRRGLTVNNLNVAASDEDSLVVSQLDAAVEDDVTVLQKEADLTFYLSYDFYPLDNPTFHRAPLYGFYQVPDTKQRLYTPQLNHVSMRMPRAPPLSQPESLDPRTLCHDGARAGRNCTDEFCACTNVLRVPLGAVVELVLVDEGVTFDANHPFHLHGSAFRVIATDRLGSTTSADEVRALDAAGLIPRKLRNAPVKDTVTVPDGGYTIVRFLADNPGFWLFHCHIEFHVEVGMAVVFQVGEQTDLPPVPPGFPRCGDYLPPDDDDDDVEVEVVPLSTAKDVRARMRGPAVQRPARSGSAHTPRAGVPLFGAALAIMMLRLRTT